VIFFNSKLSFHEKQIISQNDESNYSLNEFVLIFPAELPIFAVSKILLKWH